MMEYHEAQLTADSMRRVRFIHGLRILMSPGMIRAVVFLASVISTIVLVSVPQVVANMSHLAVQAYAPYLADAYLHTTFAVQAGVVLALAAAVWFIGDMIRNMRHARMNSELSEA